MGISVFFRSCPSRRRTNEIFNSINDDSSNLNFVYFPDESTYHVSRKVSECNVRVRETENPYVAERDSLDFLRATKGTPVEIHLNKDIITNSMWYL
ncbi:hypothetical protein AVEN_152686-1 [Araneus ventricosus]|uniref:Uncharacterized protein n=1 Tax=Araneus ventricosus TaxID=182803 RepID=A0A4Y2HXC9_ARAVE|nr:hypothetical protein AVEN_152686-1 [Araneus ventricosus]